MTDAKQLTSLLREELSLQTRHCKLLEAQQRALLACDRARFCALQDEYARLLGQLDAQAQARQALFQDEQGNALSLAALTDLLPLRQQSTLIPLRDRLKRTLECAQELCRGNRQLIENELNYIAFSLDLFVETGRQADIKYGGSRWGGRKLLDRRA